MQAFGRPEERSFSPYEVINANILFHSGVTGLFSFFCSGSEAQKPAVGLRIFGTEGSLYLENQDCGVIRIYYHNGTEETIEYTPQNGFYLEMLHMYHVLHGQAPMQVTPEVCYGDTKMVFDILESIEEQSIITVDKPGIREELYTQL